MRERCAAVDAVVAAAAEFGDDFGEISESDHAVAIEITRLARGDGQREILQNHREIRVGDFRVAVNIACTSGASVVATIGSNCTSTSERLGEKM